MSTAVKVPILPQSLREARINRWRRRVGEIIAREEALVELAVNGEIIVIVAPQAGLIEKIFFQENQIAVVGDVLALLKSGLPNLVWDEEQQALILDSYKAPDVSTSMEYELRQMIRVGEGKIGAGFGSGLALPQIPSSTEYGAGMAEEMGQDFKSNPKIAVSPQFSGDRKNPNVTSVPENPGAKASPQNAPTLGASPRLGPSAPTPRPGGAAGG